MSSEWDVLLGEARARRESIPSWGARWDHLQEVYPYFRGSRGPVVSAGASLATLHPRLGSFLVGAATPTSIIKRHGYPYARLGAAASIAGLGGLAYGAYHHLTDPPPPENFVESRIKKMEKNAWHSLWTKLASAPLIGGGVGALGGAALGYYRHKDDEDPWRYAAGHALLGGAIGATAGAGWRYGRSDKLQEARQAGQQKALDTLGVPSTLKVAPHEVVLPPSPPAAPSAAPVRRVNPLELSPEEFDQALLDHNTHWEF